VTYFQLFTDLFSNCGSCPFGIRQNYGNKVIKRKKEFQRTIVFNGWQRPFHSRGFIRWESRRKTVSHLLIVSFVTKAAVSVANDIDLTSFTCQGNRLWRLLHWPRQFLSCHCYESTSFAVLADQRCSALRRKNSCTEKRSKFT